MSDETAISEALNDAMPTRREILDAIQRGVSGAMPYPSVIAGAISDGVKEAVTAYLNTNGLTRR